MPAPSGAGTYEERACWRCDRGRVYEEGAGWVRCPGCSGTGRALAFVYPKRPRVARMSFELAEAV